MPQTWQQLTKKQRAQFNAANKAPHPKAAAPKAVTAKAPATAKAVTAKATTATAKAVAAKAATATAKAVTAKAVTTTIAKTIPASVGAIQGNAPRAAPPKIAATEVGTTEAVPSKLSNVASPAGSVASQSPRRSSGIVHPTAPALPAEAARRVQFDTATYDDAYIHPTRAPTESSGQRAMLNPNDRLVSCSVGPRAGLDGLLRLPSPPHIHATRAPAESSVRRVETDFNERLGNRSVCPRASLDGLLPVPSPPVSSRRVGLQQQPPPAVAGPQSRVLELAGRISANVDPRQARQQPVPRSASGPTSGREDPLIGGSGMPPEPPRHVEEKGLSSTGLSSPRGCINAGSSDRPTLTKPAFTGAASAEAGGAHPEATQRRLSNTTGEVTPRQESGRVALKAVRQRDEEKPCLADCSAAKSAPPKPSRPPRPTAPPTQSHRGPDDRLKVARPRNSLVVVEKLNGVFKVETLGPSPHGVVGKDAKPVSQPSKPTEPPVLLASRSTPSEVDDHEIRSGCSSAGRRPARPSHRPILMTVLTRRGVMEIAVLTLSASSG
ncbi:hypothetical protein FOZ63_030221 [Perkinsus olseni]|uniref:Uncharacterized protein n=1 Tax=Perkinsus olseni TaxID=32597 RepID=A0A7J6QHZ4_PEROL|nr:hypothetical protein FOZ63_030221 [Perkinsus olseni]